MFVQIESRSRSAHEVCAKDQQLLPYVEFVEG